MLVESLQQRTRSQSGGIRRGFLVLVAVSEIRIEVLNFQLNTARDYLGGWTGEILVRFLRFQVDSIVYQTKSAKFSLKFYPQLCAFQSACHLTPQLR